MGRLMLPSLALAMVALSGCGDTNKRPVASAPENTETFATPKHRAVSDQPIELGMVNWNRDLAAARQQAAANGKPVLVLFQEVPG